MFDCRVVIRRTRLMNSAATALAGVVLGVAPLAAHAGQAEAVEQIREVAQAGQQLAQAQLGPQLQQQTEEELGALEEIVVTGSRIPRTELTSPSPVVSLDDAEIDKRGVVRVEDLINTLPQTVAAQTSARSHGATGTATVDLRGLGAGRTLVLKDGKRLNFGSPMDVGADLNQIPSQLVERVEVLTGGASSIYGADAVAGVVNFVMKRDFEGLEADFQGSFFQSGNDNKRLRNVVGEFLDNPNINESNKGLAKVPGSDISGRTLDLSVLMGTNFAEDRGNVTMWFTYANDNPVSFASRVVSACPLNTDPNDRTQFACIGSTGAFPGEFRNLGMNLDGNPAPPFDLTLDPQGTDGIDADGDGITGLRRFNPLLDSFNFQPFSDLQRPRERFTFGAAGHYEIVPKHEFFLDTSFVRNETDTTIAPEGTFTSTFSINCDNPLLSADQLATFCQPANTIIDASGIERASLNIRRRIVAGNGIRNRPRTLETFRVVGGFRGELWDGFKYELSGQFANTDLTGSDQDIVTNLFNQALDVISDPDTGKPVCRDRSLGCVPANIFQLNPDGTTKVTQEAFDFFTTDIQFRGSTKQTVFGGNIEGDLGQYGIKSPFADSGIQSVLGFEYRRDQLSQEPDFVSQAGLAGSLFANRVPVSGKVVVYEFFGEMEVPLVKDAFLIKELTANAAYRFSDYTLTTGTGNTYTAGVSWAPTQDIRGRAQFARAVRAPNPLELFSPNIVQFFEKGIGDNGLFDPCSGDFDPNTDTPAPAATFEECARSGVTAADFGRIPDNPTGRFNTLTGGNPDLDPEKANTWTAGAILTPRFAPGLALSVDWFSVKVKRSIGVVAPNLILDGCLRTGAPVLCDRIQRGPAGDLFVSEDAFIESTNINTGSIQTKGVDVDGRYDFDLDNVGINGGTVTFHFVGTWLDKFVTKPLPGPLTALVDPRDAKFDCAGRFADRCGTPRPEFRWRFETTWSSPWALDFTATWRFIDNTQRFGNAAPTGQELSHRNYIDLSASYQLLDNVNLRVGVNNLIDKEPPVATGTGFDTSESNFFAAVFDSAGRFFFAGLNVSF